MTYLNAALSIWNQHKLPKWTAHKKLTSTAASQLKRFRKHFDSDGEALEALEAGIRFAGRQAWARAAKLTLANLGSHDKLVGYAEQALEASKPPPKATLGRVLVIGGALSGSVVKERNGWVQVLLDKRGDLTWLPKQDVEPMSDARAAPQP